MHAFQRCLLAFWLSLFASGLAVAQSLEGVLSPGPVIAAHAKWESDCSACHEYFNRAAQQKLCSDCHKPIAADIKAKTGYHGRIEDTSCKQCHTEHKGSDAKIIILDKRKFDHNKTDFPLRDGHARIRDKCESCHKPNLLYRQAPLQCNACHRKDDVHKGKLGEKCADCHNEKKWKDVVFDHDKTRFKLDGKHAKVECKDCHTEKTYKDTPRDCYSCHKDTDNKDGHKGRFGPKCATCHVTADWEEITFKHARDTHFLLKGKHSDTECIACHKGNLYTDKLSQKCVSCHRKDDDERGHKGTLGEKCENCHNEQSWKRANFDHDRDTKFPLTGKHHDAKCESCHKAGVTAIAGKAPEKLPTTCFGCHKPDDDAKGHKGKFGEKCETCHTTKVWKDITFDHNRDTHYVLRGKHARSTCASCHTGSLYGDKLSQDCVSCHRKDDEEKGHKGTQGKRCQDCHTENNWRVEKFDHNKSRFPLIASHVRVECKKCHQTPVFKNTPMECFSCHEKDDVHKRRLGTDCERCHNSRTWKSWDFDHNKTKFRIDGGHAKLECYSCHSAPMVKGKSMEMTCFSCHAKDDVHKRSFGLDCARCHTTKNWADGPRLR
jgi:hypothetical protein